MNHVPFTFFGLIKGVDHHNLHMITASFVVVLLFLATMVMWSKLKSVKNQIIPEKKLSLVNLFEMLVEMLYGLAKDVIGHGAHQYFPYVASVFCFIFFSNVIGMIPGFLPATENWATGAAVAIISFLTYNYFGFQAQGPGYIKHFFAPLSSKGIKNIFVWLLVTIPLVAFQVLFGAIEMISNLMRPITLSIRLFVNISADHQVLSVFSDLYPFLAPIPFMVLGLFVCFMQAFIFTVLNMVYISMAVAHDH